MGCVPQALGPNSNKSSSRIGERANRDHRRRATSILVEGSAIAAFVAMGDLFGLGSNTGDFSNAILEQSVDTRVTHESVSHPRDTIAPEKTPQRSVQVDCIALLIPRPCVRMIQVTV